MKTVIILDYNGLEKAAKELDVELDTKSLLEFLKTFHEDSDVQTAFAYVGVNPKLPHEKDKVVDDLWRNGYLVKTITGDTYGVNCIIDTAQAITLDVMKAVYENDTKNVIILSNSHKLSDLVVLLQEKGITTEVVYYGHYVDYDLAVKATGFIDLESFISEENGNSDEDEGKEKSDESLKLEETLVSENTNKKNEVDEIDFFDTINEIAGNFENDGKKDKDFFGPIKVEESEIKIVKQEKTEEKQ